MSENPGGWPTGPLPSEWQCACRDLCNAGADVRDELIRALTVLTRTDRPTGGNRP